MSCGTGKKKKEFPWARDHRFGTALTKKIWRKGSLKKKDGQRKEALPHLTETSVPSAGNREGRGIRR